ncbi:MAG TPA: Asp-tRNA(Asn)/Glu-tRNA(Gln) amidotransferase subunit GatA [Patescibacteria group bacterium]|nr:Asp-tRNA(Asn)/Glu-tRNA(Gln) amidotransferase subunit GatA [Patescibacteria group bacterium]
MKEKQTIALMSEALEKGECSSVELTERYLKQITGLNGALNAYLEVFSEDALASARQSDERRASGSSFGPLDGIPIAIKDNMLLQGKSCTAGSKILENYVAPEDATAVRRARAAGAVILGRTNMDEFAMGSSTERSAYGVTKNPRDPERVPGGSSGGSAAAVAADLCGAALGTDTGGSIRQPAALCGIVGLKPTYGRVSRSGIIAMASSLDQVGPMTKTAEDAGLLLQAIEGEDPLDQTTVKTSPLVMKKPVSLKGLRIGLPKEAWGEGMSDAVRFHVNEAIEILTSLGAKVTSVPLPYVEEALAVYYVLMPCEVSANLSRYDGMRYGKRETMKTLAETYAASRGHGFGEEVRRRIMLGTYALSKGYYDAYYRQAKKVQTLIRRAYENAFTDVDVLITPTTPTTAFKIGEKIHDPLAMYMEDIFTVAVNVAGLPAVSIPCGDHEGLPVGMQLIGNAFEDAKILDIGYAYEQARG